MRLASLLAVDDGTWSMAAAATFCAGKGTCRAGNVPHR